MANSLQVNGAHEKMLSKASNSNGKTQQHPIRAAIEDKSGNGYLLKSQQQVVSHMH